MEISQEAKTELKQVYLKQTGDLLTDQEAEAMAQDLFYLFEVIYRPLPRSVSKKSGANSIS
jgi:hypothetical protein